jgi:hypothetical protein
MKEKRQTLSSMGCGAAAYAPHAAAQSGKGLMGSKGTCKAKDCTREVIAKGYCRKHHRLWKAGEMPKARYKTCTGENCRKKRFRGSLCQEHYAAKTGAGAAAEGAAPAAAPAA